MEFTRAAIAEKHGTAIIGGICKSNKNKCFTLIINERTHYDDLVRSDGTIDYMGQDGGMRNHNNLSLNNSIWPLYVYRKIVDTHFYEYLGEYEKRDYAYEYRDKEDELVVMFLLKKSVRSTLE
jgi:hypothetical protein